MSLQLPAASFPGAIWDGLNASRTSHSEKRGADKEDYDRLAAEMIATQTELAAVDSYFTTFVDPNTGQLVDPTSDYYEDLRFPVSMVNVSGTRPPLATEYRGGLVYAFEYKALEAQEQVIFFNPQIPHGFRFGANASLSFHIHWTIPNNDAGKTAKFKFTANFANLNAKFASSPAHSDFEIITLGADDAHEHKMLVIGPIDATTFTKSAMGLCSLWRASSEEVNHTTQPIYLLEADFHYIHERFGS